MADWNKKYYFSFKDVEDVNYTVEIWEDIPDGSPIPVAALIQGDLDPLTLDYPGAHLFTPVRASGAVITLLSTSDRMFNNLFTREMLKYQVRVYKTVWVTPIYSIESPVWLGFLDTENYSEPFDSLTNYPVQVTANDGFNLLGRMSYIDYKPTLETYSKLTGIDSAWQVLNRILQRLNLPWDSIYVGLSTTIPDVTIAADENLLEKLYLNNDNWYNEDGEPETCRTVLENLLAILSAFIVQIDGSLYITDRQHLSTGTTASFKRYTYGYETTTYNATVSISINNGDISTVGLQSSRVSMSVETGINKQVVSYNAYPLIDIINFNAKDDFSGVASTTTRGATFYQWTETIYNNSLTWTKFNNGYFASLIGIDGRNRDVSAEYLKLDNVGLTGIGLTEQGGLTSGNKTFEYKLPLPNVFSSAYSLRFRMSVYFRTVDDLNNVDTPPTIGIKTGLIQCRLTIGDKKYHRGFYSWDAGWVDLTDSKDLTLSFYDFSDSLTENPINDRWFDLGHNVIYFAASLDNQVRVWEDYIIPLNDPTLEGGLMTFEIYGYRVYDESVSDFTEIAIKDCRIKNFSITVVDQNGDEVKNTDFEYTSKLDQNFSNSGQPAKVLLGTNTIGYPVQRANLLLYEGGVYTYLSEATRNGVTDIPEKLLLRSIKSNYAEPNIQLTLETPAKTNQIGYYTYSSYLSGKKLAVLSNKINLSENVSQLTLREFHNDFATITE